MDIEKEKSAFLDLYKYYPSAIKFTFIGEVTAIEHKEYLITESDTLYAAIVWDDSNDQVGFWGFFKTEEEAEKAAAHCKAMREAAQEPAND